MRSPRIFLPMSEPENLILAPLRELRSDIKPMEQRLEARFEAIEKRLDAMHLNGTKALRSFIGHRAIFERTMASLDSDIADLKQRVERLEAARA